MLKKVISLLMVLCTSFALAACGNAAETTSEPSDDTSVESETPENEVPEIEEPEIEESEIEEPEIEEDENAPEFINANCIKETTNVSLYSSSWVDNVYHDFRGFDFKLPNELEVSKAHELHESDDPRSTGVTVPEFLKENDKKYSYLELRGKLSGSSPVTNHEMVLSVSQKDAPITQEALEAEYKNTVVEVIEKEGVNGFLLYPDATKAESGIAGAIIVLNLGSYEHAYGTDYYVGNIIYQGGFMDYADVDVNEISSTLLSLLDVGAFEEVK